MGHSTRAASRPFLDAATEAVKQALTMRPDNVSYRRIARKLAETSAELCLKLEDAGGAAAAVDVLLAELLAPADPALGSGPLVRSSHLLIAKGDTASMSRASELMTKARGLLRAAIDGGRSLAEIREQPSMRDQRGKTRVRRAVCRVRVRGRTTSPTRHAGAMSRRRLSPADLQLDRVARRQAEAVRR